MYADTVAACIRQICGGYAEPHTQNLDPIGGLGEKEVRFHSVRARISEWK